MWDLVPGRSPVGWRWAHLKALQAFGQCVFLRGLVTKDVLFPPRGHRKCTLCLSGHWILSVYLGSSPSLTSVNPHCPQGQQQGLSLRAPELGCQQVSPGTGPWARGVPPEGAAPRAAGQAAGQGSSALPAPSEMCSDREEGGGMRAA